MKVSLESVSCVLLFASHLACGATSDNQCLSESEGGTNVPTCSMSMLFVDPPELTALNMTVNQVQCTDLQTCFDLDQAEVSKSSGFRWIVYSAPENVTPEPYACSGSNKADKGTMFNCGCCMQVMKKPL